LRGKVEELAIPAWPHELQAILSSMMQKMGDLGIIVMIASFARHKLGPTYERNGTAATDGRAHRRLRIAGSSPDRNTRTRPSPNPIQRIASRSKNATTRGCSAYCDRGDLTVAG
jgi:hypothetical protein